jgi:uncharacterized membrane protein YidH (DUF202 family)
MRKRYIPTIVLIGWALLSLSILIDDISTAILFKFGFGIAETNPIYQSVGATWFLIILTLSYLFIGWAWYYENTVAIKKIKKKETFYKLQDVLVFVACFILAFIVVTKVNSGISNVNQMVDYINEKEMIQEQLTQLSTLKQDNPIAYNQITSEVYNSQIDNISYMNLLIIMLISYLLFRSGYEVRPWD